MRTPYGKACRYYYEDFNRGRNIKECRLAKENIASERWRPQDCEKCPVPAILNANASPHLQLKLTIATRFLGLSRQLQVSAHCSRHRIAIEDPYIGCPQCLEERPSLDLFKQAFEQNDDD